MKTKNKSDLWIYGRDFLKPLTQISMNEWGESPKVFLDSNVSGRYSTYSHALNSIPCDIITVLAEVEQSINNDSAIITSPFEKLPDNSELRGIKESLREWHKNAFNKKIANHYQGYMNSIPKLKGRNNLERINCLIKHHEEHSKKGEISFYLLLCLMNISLNCDQNNHFKGLIHYPQLKYSIEEVKNFLFDFLIIDTINKLIDDGENVFFCTNDEGAAYFASYISKLTLIISIHGLHENPSKDGLYGIEKEIYKNIVKDKNHHEIITKIRKAIYTRWKGNYKRMHKFQYTPISQAIVMAL
ncbi:hypothetical protein AGJ41_07225 [Cronobacter dublinensis subsp. dublinensis]|nr:hypothetical protein [Cronobacter dublinensis subsp. dublinensis]EGT5669340.1 hypothetical protein [Cronobacter dublinensis subsp. dublinensis]EGT5686256.1 hypothetical protein [Cronobacter dublinensis subsp. dublinensis]EGT5690303.1 hypothetical protein [Cronobacter dublinensis subsp. dublinensis]EGT5699541.1 hypothetical protein [Cronobacter dublinensis subsp. dublinensis]